MLLQNERGTAGVGHAPSVTLPQTTHRLETAMSFVSLFDGQQWPEKKNKCCKTNPEKGFTPNVGFLLLSPAGA